MGRVTSICTVKHTTGLVHLTNAMYTHMLTHERNMLNDICTPWIVLEGQVRLHTLCHTETSLACQHLPLHYYCCAMLATQR